MNKLVSVGTFCWLPFSQPVMYARLPVLHARHARSLKRSTFTDNLNRKTARGSSLPPALDLLRNTHPSLGLSLAVLSTLQPSITTLLAAQLVSHFQVIGFAPSGNVCQSMTPMMHELSKTMTGCSRRCASPCGVIVCL